MVAALAINLGAKSLELIPMAWVRRITATILLGLGIYTAVIALDRLAELNPVFLEQVSGSLPGWPGCRDLLSGD